MPAYCKTCFVLGLLLLTPLAACGGKSDEKAGSTTMKDLEAADGTINDAMTDLDGVQVQGTAVADMGNAGAANASGAQTKTGEKVGAGSTDNGAEVVSEQ